MKAIIDKAGGLVIPKLVRGHLGLCPGPVQVMADGAALRVELVADDVLDERAGRLLVPASGAVFDDDLVRSLRDADRR